MWRKGAKEECSPFKGSSGPWGERPAEGGGRRNSPTRAAEPRADSRGCQVRLQQGLQHFHKPVPLRAAAPTLCEKGVLKEKLACPQAGVEQSWRDTSIRREGCWWQFLGPSLNTTVL